MTRKCTNNQSDRLLRTVLLMGFQVWLMVAGGCTGGKIHKSEPCTDALPQGEQAQMRSRKLYAQAIDARRAGQTERSGQLLEQALAEDPNNTHAWLALGVVHYERDMLYESAKAFEKAAQLEPGRCEPRLNLGTVLESAGQYAKAIQAYESTLELVPDDVAVMENLARCLVRSNTNLPRARQLIDRALQLEDRQEWINWLTRQSHRLAGLENRQDPPGGLTSR